MSPEEINAIVTLMRRAPLQNMQEAEGAAFLIDKLQQHFAKQNSAKTPAEPVE